MNKHTDDANLAHVLLERARTMPEATALIQHDRRVTFAELEQRSARGASILRRARLRQGDAVLVFQPVSVELYVALLAIFRLGLTAMFVDPSAGLAHLERCCALGRPRGFIGPWKAQALRLVSGALRGIERTFLTGGGWWPGPVTQRWHSLQENAPAHEEIEPVPADFPALLTFTSGSTGQPKAAVRTHGFLLAQHHALSESLALAAGEVDLATLPVFVLANLASGVTSVLPDADLRRPARFNTGPVARQIAAYRPTRSAGSPAFFERLLDEVVPLNAFTKIYLGGAPIFPGLLTRLRAATGPGAEIVVVYGSTEAEPMAEFSARELTDADLATMRTGGGLLVGAPVPSVRLRVVRDRWGEPLGAMSADEFAAVSCATGEAGEIVVSGGHVLPGYLHGHGDEETKFRVDGVTWHRTGDAGRLDAAGKLWLLGRCAAKVADARGVQYPLAVECAAVLLLDTARRCAFVGAADRRTLLIEAKTPRRGAVSADDLARLKTLLPWAGLDEVRLVRTVPVDRRHNAKVDYIALAKLRC